MRENFNFNKKKREEGKKKKREEKIARRQQLKAAAASPQIQPDLSAQTGQPQDQAAQ